MYTEICTLESYTEISGYTERIHRTHDGTRCISIKRFAATKISGYVWTGPKKFLLTTSVSCMPLHAGIRVLTNTFLTPSTPSCYINYLFYVTVFLVVNGNKLIYCFFDTVSSLKRPSKNYCKFCFLLLQIVIH